MMKAAKLNMLDDEGVIFNMIDERCYIKYNSKRQMNTYTNTKIKRSQNVA